MLNDKSLNENMSLEARKRLDNRVMSIVRKKKDHMKTFSIAAITVLALTGGAIAGFQLTGRDAPTGHGDVLFNHKVISQAQYDTEYSDKAYAFDGFIYTDALNLQLRFSSNEELEKFTSDLKPLQNETVSKELKEKFSGEHIVYANRKISTMEFTELHKEDKAVWVKCYLPQELRDGDIRAYDSEEEYSADNAPC